MRHTQGAELLGSPSQREEGAVGAWPELPVLPHGHLPCAGGLGGTASAPASGHALLRCCCCFLPEGWDF